MVNLLSKKKTSSLKTLAAMFQTLENSTKNIDTSFGIKMADFMLLVLNVSINQIILAWVFVALEHS